MQDDDNGGADMIELPFHDTDIRANPYVAGRRVAIGANGMVASAHPYATLAGLDMLRDGGNAIDAAITVAAVLAVVEPAMTGMGGDVFALYYDAATKRVNGLNGSGRAPAALTFDFFQDKGAATVDAGAWEAVTVPGAVDAWWTAHDKFGRKPFGELLEPAITFAAEGYRVGERVAGDWAACVDSLSTDAKAIYSRNGKAPGVGELMINAKLAESLRLVATGGPDAYYRGPIAAAIVDYAAATGGFLTADDFAEHRSTWVDPIYTDYRGFRCWQIPPNGQGLGVLMMLNILDSAGVSAMSFNSPEYLHMLIEAKKLAYEDLYAYVADPAANDLITDKLLSKQYAKDRAKLIDRGKAADIVDPGLPAGSDTTCFSVADGDGNAVSFINSIFAPFGSGIVGGESGILLQNRGAGFSLQPGHVNCYAPGKRPFHTIIPGMVTRDDDLYLAYGLMGAAMQPQGHAQFLLSHLDHGLTLQEAADVPRWNHLSGLQVLMEHGTPLSTMEALAVLGHTVVPVDWELMGGAQAIMLDQGTGCYVGASDPRKDGLALGY